MASAPMPRITESQVLRDPGSTTMSVIIRSPASMPSNPATFWSMAGTSCVPGTPPASASPKVQGGDGNVLGVGREDHALGTERQLADVLELRRLAGRSLGILCRPDPGHRQAQAQDDDEQHAETELGHAESPFRRIILRLSSFPSTPLATVVIRRTRATRLRRSPRARHATNHATRHSVPSSD